MNISISACLLFESHPKTSLSRELVALSPYYQLTKITGLAFIQKNDLQNQTDKKLTHVS